MKVSNEEENERQNVSQNNSRQYKCWCWDAKDGGTSDRLEGNRCCLRSSASCDGERKRINWVPRTYQQRHYHIHTRCIAGTSPSFPLLPSLCMHHHSRFTLRKHFSPPASSGTFHSIRLLFCSFALFILWIYSWSLHKIHNNVHLLTGQTLAEDIHGPWKRGKKKAPYAVCEWARDVSRGVVLLLPTACLHPTTFFCSLASYLCTFCCNLGLVSLS